MNIENEIPWYRVMFVWLLLALPLTAVVAGFVTLALAITSDDGVVVDDYYRRGKEINRDLTRDHAAAARGIGATLVLDEQRQQLVATLRAAQPPEVELLLVHSTRQGNDHRAMLFRGRDGQYRASLPMLGAGRYDVQLASENWRISGSFHVPGDAQAELSAAVAH